MSNKQNDTYEENLKEQKEETKQKEQAEQEKKLSPKQFLRKELIKNMPLTKLGKTEKDILEKRFGLNGQKTLSLPEVAEFYQTEITTIGRMENKALAKVIENIY